MLIRQASAGISCCCAGRRRRGGGGTGSTARAAACACADKSLGAVVIHMHLRNVLHVAVALALTVLVSSWSRGGSTTTAFVTFGQRTSGHGGCVRCALWHWRAASQRHLVVLAVPSPIAIDVGSNVGPAHAACIGGSRSVRIADERGMIANARAYSKKHAYVRAHRMLRLIFVNQCVACHDGRQLTCHPAPPPITPGMRCSSAG